MPTSKWTPGITSLSPNSPKEAFYSKFSDAHISDEDYTHAQKVSATFWCKSLGDYSDLYSRIHVLLLADFFETFRKMCLHQYVLDPAHYYTSPAFHGTPYSKRQEWSSSCSQIMTSTCSSRRGCAEVSQWSQSAMPKPTIIW